MKRSAALPSDGHSANKRLFTDVATTGNTPPAIPQHSYPDNGHAGSSNGLAAALYPDYHGESGVVHYAQDDHGIHTTGVNPSYPEQQQARPLERKLSMSKPTNLDELLSEDLDNDSSKVQSPANTVNENPAEKVNNVDNEHYIPDHERTQEIDIDAILFGDCLEDTPEETEEELDKENANFSFNSNEIDSVTRYNTKLNSGPIIATVDMRSLYPAATGSGTSYSVHDKITTFNGETTFSASPPSPGYIATNLTEEFQSGSKLSEARILPVGNVSLEKMAPVNKSQHHQAPQQLAGEDFHQSYLEKPPQPLFVHHQLAELQPQEIELERQLQQLELQDQALLEEQKQLEVEQLRLAQENSILEAQLQAKEKERQASEADDSKKRKKTEVVFSEKKQVFTQRFDTKVEEPKKPKPKSIFNFDSLKKKKRKNRPLVTEGYDSAYEDLTDNEETGKSYRHKEKKQFQFPGYRAETKDMMPETKPSLPIQEQQHQTEANIGEADIAKKKTARGFTKFLSKDKKEHLNIVDLETSDDPRESDNETVIVHPDEPVGSIPPPAEFRQNNLAESIVYELKKSSSQLNNSDRKSSAADVKELNLENSFSRGKNRFSMRKNRKDSVKDKKENGISPKSEGTSPAAATALSAEGELLERVKSRFSMRKPQKATKGADVRNSGTASEVESGEDSGSLSRVKNRFSLRKSKSKTRIEDRKEANNVSVDNELAHDGLVIDTPPAINALQTVENDQNELEINNHADSGQQEPSRSVTPVAVNKGPPISRQDSRSKKSSSGLAGIFSMRASKRSKSTERPKSYVGQPPKGLQQPQRPRSAVDLSKAGPSGSQIPTVNRPKGNLANYFGVSEEIPANPASANELINDPFQIKKSQSADLALEKTAELVPEQKVGLISQSKSIIGMTSEQTFQGAVTYTEVDFKTAQNSRKVADEIKTRFQGKQKVESSGPDIRQREAGNQFVTEKPPKAVIERPRTSPPARPQIASTEKPPSKASEKTPKLLNVFSKNSQPANDTNSRSHKKIDAEVQEVQHNQKQQKEPNSELKQQGWHEQIQQNELQKQQQLLLQEQQQQSINLQQQQQNQLKHQQKQQQAHQQPPRSFQYQNQDQHSNSRPPSSLDGSVIGGRGRQTGRQSGRFRRGGAPHSSSSMSHSRSLNQSMNSSFDQDSIAEKNR
jgi:hypothetical protein